MSRPLLHVTLTTTGGKVMEGNGRNLSATVEKIYNQGFGKRRGRHAVISEHMRTGHAEEKEHRYEGTFHGRVLGDDGMQSEEESFLVQVSLMRAGK